MHLRYALVILMMLTGCDKLTGVADQKTSDAEAIGYACRVSMKKPEDCMKENDGQSTTSILAGWKAADKDIQEKKLDPSMGADSVIAIQSASAPDGTRDEKSAKKSGNATPDKAATESPELEKKSNK